MKFHICVPIDRALLELQKGNNIFTGTPLEAFHDLMEAKEKGHKFYTGCENVDEIGICQGHDK